MTAHHSNTCSVLYVIIRDNIFYICSNYYHKLNPIPTRLSSDLIELRQHVEFCQRQAELRAQHGIQRRKQLAMQRQQLQPKPGRSEEHKSELQSRGHIVCSLQLGKKEFILNMTI